MLLRGKRICKELAVGETLPLAGHRITRMEMRARSFTSQTSFQDDTGKLRNEAKQPPPMRIFVARPYENTQHSGAVGDIGAHQCGGWVSILKITKRSQMIEHLPALLFSVPLPEREGARG
jgi:hypothetical protein